MHAERRKDIDLIGLEQVELVVHAHVLAAAQVDVELIIVMAVILGHFHLLIKTVTGFIPLTALSHWLEWRLNLIVFQRNTPRFGCAAFA